MRKVLAGWALVLLASSAGAGVTGTVRNIVSTEIFSVSIDGGPFGSRLRWERAIWKYLSLDLGGGIHRDIHIETAGLKSFELGSYLDLTFGTSYWPLGNGGLSGPSLGAYLRKYIWTTNAWRYFDSNENGQYGSAFSMRQGLIAGLELGWSFALGQIVRVEPTILVDIYDDNVYGQYRLFPPGTTIGLRVGLGW